MHRETPPAERRVPADGHTRFRREHDHFIFEDVQFPATKQELVDVVLNAEVDLDAINLVNALPNRTYMNRKDVWWSFDDALRSMVAGPA